MCICKPGWEGDNCKVPYCSTNCSSNGVCIGYEECKCNPGWNGDSCSYSECTKHTNCKSCTTNEGCGWCDENKSCMNRDFFNNSRICNNWFYYNCLTTEDSTGCSNNIDRIPCEMSFCYKNSSYYSKSKCQKCTDFENCFNNDTFCRSWDNKRCPLGTVNQDYANLSRLDFVEFKENVLPINQNETILYKCSSLNSNYSIFMFKNQTLKNKIVINDILISDQVDGVLHKINSIYDLNNNFTLINAKPASIEEIIDYADFKSAGYVYELDNELTREQVPDDDFFDYMKNFTNMTIHHIDPQLNTYKCIGKAYESILDNTLLTEYTTIIVVKASAETRSYKINDLLRSEFSSGYLERVKKLNKFNAGNTKAIVETELINCNELNFEMNYIEILNKTQKELDCIGGNDFMPGLIIVNENVDLNLIGKIISGRQSASYMMKIIKIKEYEGYLFFESMPIIGLDEKNEPISFKTIKSAFNKQKSSKIDVNSFTYTKQLRYPFDFGLILAELSCSIKAQIGLKFGLKFDKNIKEISVSLKSNLDIDLSYYMKILTAEKVFYKAFNILSNKKILNFYLPIGPILIPGKLLLDLDFEKQLTIKRFISTDLKLSLKSTTLYQNNFIYLIDNYSFNYKPTYEQTTSFENNNNLQNLHLYRNSTYSLQFKLTPKLKVRWPNILSFKKTTKREQTRDLPIWLNAKLRKDGRVSFDLNFEFSASFPLRVAATLNFCSWKCIDGTKSNELIVRYGLDSIYFDFLINLLVYSKSFHIPTSLELLNTNSTCLSSIVPCCLCSNNQPGIIDPQTQACMCECFLQIIQ